MRKVVQSITPTGLYCSTRLLSCIRAAPEATASCSSAIATSLQWLSKTTLSNTKNVTDTGTLSIRNYTRSVQFLSLLRLEGASDEGVYFHTEKALCIEVQTQAEDRKREHNEGFGNLQLKSSIQIIWIFLSSSNDLRTGSSAIWATLNTTWIIRRWFIYDVGFHLHTYARVRGGWQQHLLVIMVHDELTPETIRNWLETTGTSEDDSRIDDR